MGQPDRRRIILGTLGAPNGLKGWLNVQLNMHNPMDLKSYSPCYVDRRGELTPVQIENVQQRGTKWLIKLGGCDSREAAESFRLFPLVIERSDLPALDEGEFYWSDLEGLTVVLNEREIGVVDHLYHNAGTDVMVITRDEGMAQIPFVRQETVKKVDLKAKVIEVDWPEDML